MGAFDIPLSIISSENAIINFNVALVLKGMAAHKSQNVWYRVLFVLFCRYTYVNTFRSINWRSHIKTVHGRVLKLMDS